MNKKNLPYILVIVLIIVAAAYVFYTQFAPLPHLSNATALAFDNQPVSTSTYSELYSIANNQSLARGVSIAFASNPGYQKINGTELYAGGKPEMLYVGAEYCPYCAITRWSMMIALMRFGNFTGLHYMTSSGVDVFPNTATFTFYNSTYSSPYLTFVPVETTTNKPDPATGFYYPLQSINASQTVVFSAYDKNSDIPFVDFGNQSLQVGTPINPQIVAGKNWTDIISSLNQPSSQISENIIGTANLYTTAICEEIGNKAPVCSQSYVESIEKYD